MADVQIQQPSSGSSGGSGLAWAIVVLVLLGIIAWFVFGGGFGRQNRVSSTKVDINIPTPSAPAPSTPNAPAPNPPSGGGAPKP